MLYTSRCKYRSAQGKRVISCDSECHFIGLVNHKPAELAVLGAPTLRFNKVPTKNFPCKCFKDISAIRLHSVSAPACSGVVVPSKGFITSPTIYLERPGREHEYHCKCDNASTIIVCRRFGEIVNRLSSTPEPV